MAGRKDSVQELREYFPSKSINSSTLIDSETLCAFAFIASGKLKIINTE